VPSNDVDDSKVVENIHIPPKIIRVIEDILVGSHTLISEGHP